LKETIGLNAQIDSSLQTTRKLNFSASI